MALSTNNIDYTVVSNRELSSVLGYFSPEMTMSILDNVIEDRIRNHSQALANLPFSYETNIKLAIDSYSNINRELLERRNQTYLSIIDRLCAYHQLSCNLGTLNDLYAPAYYIYDLLISNFQTNIMTFFYNFIMREKINLYESLNLSDTKKNKDSSAIYSKRISNGSDNILAAIHANLDLVITQLIGYDIGLSDFINLVYPLQVSEFLNSILVDNGDFYRRFIVPTIMGPDKPIFITKIRLIIQGDLQPPTMELIAIETPDQEEEGE